MADKPAWRRAFDRLEGPLGSALEDVARSARFAEALGLSTRARAGVRRELERHTRRLWHAANLPAGSDVAHLRRQVAALDRELRQVRRALEQAETRREGERDGPARSRQAGRRSQRAPRS
jgi:post-segregation antitoxin (ccd killing protein)